MKKILIVKICLLVSISAFGVASLAQIPNFLPDHSWSKLTEQNGVNGEKVCTWVCRHASGSYTGSSEHHTTTSGRGYCPLP
jgi:hypothetical protein